MQTRNDRLIQDALFHLNSHYGIGDLGSSIIHLDGTVEFEQRPFLMKRRWRRGRIVNGTLYALGHQRKLEP